MSLSAMPGRDCAVRVVLADDELFFRQLLAQHLRARGIDVVAEAGDPARLRQAVAALRPDVAIVDLKLPPGEGTEGLHSAIEIRRRYPEVGILLLSHYLQTQFLGELLAGGQRRVGYLLKESVADADFFIQAVYRIAQGGYVVDPQVVAAMMGRPTLRNALAALTKAELRVLSFMAEGHSNTAIAERLTVALSTIETHVSKIFQKLGLDDSERQQHRRVQAVLVYLQSRRQL